MQNLVGVTRIEICRGACVVLVLLVAIVADVPGSNHFCRFPPVATILVATIDATVTATAVFEGTLVMLIRDDEDVATALN